MAYDLTDLVTVGQNKALAQRVRNALSSINATTNLSHETFTFELDDGTTVSKEIVLWTSQA